MQPKITSEQLKQLNASSAKGIVWIICKDCGFAIECKKGEASYELMSEIPICGNCWWNRLPLFVWKELKDKSNDAQIELARPYLLAIREQEITFLSA
jgi:hypothetical protein